jgi:hypothetical protein
MAREYLIKSFTIADASSEFGGFIILIIKILSPIMYFINNRFMMGKFIRTIFLIKRR